MVVLAVSLIASSSYWFGVVNRMALVARVEPEKILRDFGTEVGSNNTIMHDIRPIHVTLRKHCTVPGIIISAHRVDIDPIVSVGILPSKQTMAGLSALNVFTT